MMSRAIELEWKFDHVPKNDVAGLMVAPLSKQNEEIEFTTIPMDLLKNLKVRHSIVNYGYAKHSRLSLAISSETPFLIKPAFWP